MCAVGVVHLDADIFELRGRKPDSEGMVVTGDREMRCLHLHAFLYIWLLCELAKGVLAGTCSAQDLLHHRMRFRGSSASCDNRPVRKDMNQPIYNGSNAYQVVTWYANRTTHYITGLLTLIYSSTCVVHCILQCISCLAGTWIHLLHCTNITTVYNLFLRTIQRGEYGLNGSTVKGMVECTAHNHMCSGFSANAVQCSEPLLSGTKDSRAYSALDLYRSEMHMSLTKALLFQRPPQPGLLSQRPNSKVKVC